MKKLVFLLLGGAAFCLSNCGSGNESAREKQAAGDSTVTRPGLAGLQDAGVEILTKPSGVRYQEIVVGEGKEIVKGSYVEFDYSSWLSDASGLARINPIGSSVGKPGQSFKGEVGVQPLPGLSDGLIGMKVGGSRRVFVPGELGFKSGTPFVGRNSVFEVIGIKEITPEEVTHYHDSVAQWLAMVQRVQDSARKAFVDSLAAQGLDSLGQPLDGGGI